MEGILCEDANETDTLHLPKEAEFTINLMLRKLRLPPLNLYNLSQSYFTFFNGRKVKYSTNIYLNFKKYTIGLGTPLKKLRKSTGAREIAFSKLLQKDRQIKRTIVRTNEQKQKKDCRQSHS